MGSVNSIQTLLFITSVFALVAGLAGIARMWLQRQRQYVLPALVVWGCFLTFSAQAADDAAILRSPIGTGVSVIGSVVGAGIAIVALAFILAMQRHR